MAGAGIITFLHNNNYGSALQAYALQRTVSELGVESVHLDYNPDRLEKIRKLTGLDLREFDHAIIFKVALMVKKYLDSSPIKY